MNAVDIVALQELGAQAIANAELASTQHLQLLERIQQLSHLSGHKVALVKDVAKGMDRSAPVSTLVPQEMATVLAGGSPEERALVHRISHAQAQQDAHQDDKTPHPRTSDPSTIRTTLQKHTLAAQRRSPAHLPPSSAVPPTKRSRAISSKPDTAPHAASLSPQKPPISASALPASAAAAPEPPAASAHPPPAPRNNVSKVQTSAIPGVVAPASLPPKGPLPMPSNVASSAWPVLPYLENVEYAIAHADSQPLTFHRTVSRPLSDFLTAVMHSLGVQDACYTGLGTYLMRAFIADHCAGRLAVYEGLQRYAATSNWQGFLIACLEYIESAGYDTARLFKVE